jgi:hypothetical protein
MPIGGGTPLSGHVDHGNILLLSAAERPDLAAVRAVISMSGRSVRHAVHMESVVIRDVRTALVFSDPDSAMKVPAQYLSVAIEGPGLRASRQVYEAYDEGFSGLARYFSDLAANWRGWRGSRDYESIEGDLRIQATHDGHVKLRVTLWESTVPEGWRVEAEVRLDAGEALTAAASEVAALVRARLP